MRNLKRLAILIITLFLFLISGHQALAALSSYVEYWPCSGGSGCQLTQIPLTAISTTNAPVSVGDSNGSANAQSNYGTLTASASGGYLGGEPPTLTSYGFANPTFDDTITLSGGTGNAPVKATLRLIGTISTTTVGSGTILPTVSFTVNGGLPQYAQLSLFQTSGDGNVTLIDNTTATWASSNGTFTQGDNGSIYPVSPNGTMTLTVNLPYNTPVTLQVDLGVEGLDSVSTITNASLTLELPPGATLSSESGASYGAATTVTTSTTVPVLPEIAFWILFSLLAWIGIQKSKLNKKYRN